MPVCSVCKKDLSEERFKLVNSRGKKIRRKQCRKCYYERSRENELKDQGVRDRRRATVNKSQKALRHTPLGWCKQAARSLKSKSTKRNIPFNLTHMDLFEIFPRDGLCPILSVTLVIDCHHPHNASVDRLKPEFGYTVGNVAIISARANSIKNNATSTEIMLVAEWLAKIERA